MRTQTAVVLLLLTASSIAGRPLAAQQGPITECGSLIPDAGTARSILLPQGEIFCPLVADPKEMRTFASLVQGRSPGQVDSPDRPSLSAFETTIAAIGLGDGLGLVRWDGSRAGDGVQFGIGASIFAQFDAAGLELINADYLLGLPLTFRKGGFSGRLRVYHQSSHLGDEFLLREEPERVNLSFESVELILSQSIGILRVYAGGEQLFNREPAELAPRLAHGGIELRPGSGQTRFIASLDVKSSGDADWRPAWSARTGIEVGRAREAGVARRTVRLVAEFYEGPSPYGQFYRDRLRYVGVGVHIAH